MTSTIETSSVRRWSGRLALVLSVAAALWATRLYVLGGFDTTFLGISITTNDPVRPALASSVLLLIFRLAAGRNEARRLWSRVVAIEDRNLALVLSLSVVSAGVWFGTMAATGSDPYGYVSEADHWIRGSLKTSQPWVNEVPWPRAGRTFVPLAYHPRSDYGLNDDSTLVPTYAPGLPLLMALAKIVGGDAAAYCVVPLSAGVLILATFGLGCRLVSSRAGLVAAWFLATSPVLVYMVMWPMSDVPVAAAWTLTFYSMLGPTWRHAVLAGIACAVAVLVRPNLFGLMLLPTLWYCLNLYRVPSAGRVSAFGSLAIFSIPASIGPLATAAIYWNLYGSPTQSGYGDVSSTFALAHVVPNLRNYTMWAVSAQTPAVLFGCAALLWPAHWLWPRSSSRMAVPLFGAAVAAIVAYYSAYLVFDDWWYLRFLLPAWPLLLVGLAAVTIAVASRWKTSLATVIAIAVVVVGLRGVQLSAERFAFDLWRAEHRYVVAAQLVRRMTPENSVVFSVLHSGSVRHYAGRITLRFDELEGEWLDKGVGWLAERGVSSYLLVDDLEVTNFQARFKGQATLSQLASAPVASYTGTQKVFLFHLAGPRSSSGTDTMVDTYDGARVVAPAPPGTLVLGGRP